MSTPFLALSPEEAAQRINALGGRTFHARIVRRELLERGVLDYEGMSALPKSLRGVLARELPLLAGSLAGRTLARDGTRKLLIALGAGGAVETVHMPAQRPGRGATLCVSTQVGCPVGCPFCASGALGLERNLAAHEILEQFLRGRAEGPVARCVVMGIGEPLLNYEALLAALRVVNAELKLGARRITVSTVGFPDRLRRIAPTRPPFQLAISLHSPDDEQRWKLVPAMAGVPIEEVLAAGDHWFEMTGREVTYEYVLLGEVNDTLGDARRLAERLAGRRATVNLIPYNPTSPLGTEFGRPTPDQADAFTQELVRTGIVATLRRPRGVETDAACGQLRLRQVSASG